MKRSDQMSRYVIGKIAVLLILALSVVQIQGAGTHGKDPTGTSDPSNIDSDDDGLPDTEDAVPDDPEINWLKSSESRYVWIEQMTTPQNDNQRLIPPVAVNSSGQILFPYYTVGEWDSGTETKKNHLWDSAKRQWADLPHTGSQGFEIEGGPTFTATDQAGGFIDINDAGTVSAFGRGNQDSPPSSTVGAHRITTQPAMIWEKTGTSSAYGLPKYFIYHGAHSTNSCNSRLDLSNWTHGGTPYHWSSWRAPGGRIGMDGSMNLCAHIGDYKLSPVWLMRDGTSSSRLLDQTIKQLGDNQVSYLSQVNYSGTFPGAILDKNHALFVETLRDTNTSNVWLKDGEDVTTIASVTPPLDNYDNHDTDMIFAPSTKDDNTERLWIAAGNKILLEKRAGGAGAGRWHNPASMAEGAIRLNARGEAITPGKPAAAAPTRPKLWRNGLYIDLNEVATKPDTVTITKAIDLASNGIILAQATENGVAKTGLLVPVEVVPDYNRDGKIDQADRGKVSTAKPWRFWVNDDEDFGETGGSDISIPNYPSVSFPNYVDSLVNGIRDLVDFFPLHFDLKSALALMPETECQYFLMHESQHSTPSPGGLVTEPSFNVLWYPQAVLDGEPKEATGAGSYFKNLEKAVDIANRSLSCIPSSGLRIPNDMLLAAKIGKGVALFEGRYATDNPIQIEIRKNGTVIAKMDFPVKISPAQDMFRYKFVMPGASNLNSEDIPGNPPNWPDADRNGKHFVFVHGYNVNDTQSKGWGAEFFKRMFWSGSNARFSAFAWYGYQSQISTLTPDYQVNLDNAFGTAKSFKQFLDLLEGEKTVAGHSMGNILVGSAMHDWGARPKNYLMLNAAAAKECYDPAEADEPAQDAAMENQIWRGYPKELRASEWHRLLPPAAWPGSDWRGKLTWRGRFANVIQNGGQTDVYNFYSSGEEVLNNPTLITPQTNDAITELWSKANRVWAVQEKRKGHGITGIIHTSNHGGWRFNLMTAYDAVIHDNSSGNILMKTLVQLPNPLNNAFLLHLASNPFFDRSAHPTLYDPQTGAGTPGSDYARNHRNTIISEMIPCTSFAAGRNSINLLGGNNIDMNTQMKTDLYKWPLSNANENNKLPTDRESRPWLHSDIREKAFTHNWNAYKKFVELGNLNQAN